MIKGETKVVGKVVEYRPRKHKQYVPGKMILRMREEAVAPHVGARVGLRGMAAAAAALPADATGPLEWLRKNAGLKRVFAPFAAEGTQPAHRAGPAGRGGARMAVADNRVALVASVTGAASADLRGFTVVDIDPKKVRASVKALKDSKAVEIIEPMPARWVAATARAAGPDPMQNLQWGLRAIKWFDATLPANGREVVVGVMDTGIDTTHPDLRRVTKTYDHTGSSARDLIGHGTHVAGIIAALANNDVGITGVSTCRLHVWKIFDDEPDPDDGEYYVNGDAYLRALGAARRVGIKALNLSIGGTASSRTEQILFRRLEAAGVTVVAAMGNEFQDGNPTSYPAAYKGVFAVGAVAETLRRSVFSNTGRHIAISAPGSNILSTLPMRGSDALDETEYAAWSGTSMATPHVAAAAGLVAAANPNFGPAQVKARLTDTAATVPGMNQKKWTSAFGAGLLDLAAAL